MTDSERDLELLTAAAVISPPRRWIPQGIPQRLARSNGQLRLNYRQPGRDADPDLFTLNIDPPPEASGSALMQGLADHAAVVAPLSAIERGSTIGDEGPINEAFLSTPVVRLIAGAHYVLRSAVLVPAGGLLYLNGATVSDLSLILLGPGGRIADQTETRRLLHFGDGLIWRADGANELANLPAGQVGQHYNSVLEAAGGQPPYVWAVTGTLPPGLHLDVPLNFAPPVVVAQRSTLTAADPQTLTTTVAVPANARLLFMVGMGLNNTGFLPAVFTDSAGNSYQPFVISELSVGIGQTYQNWWQCRTEFPMPAGTVLTFPAVGTVQGGVGLGVLIWIPGALSGVTATRGAVSGATGATPPTLTAQLPGPFGDAGQLTISACRSGLLAATPAWTPDSGTQTITTIPPSDYQTTFGVNYPSPGSPPPSPQADFGGNTSRWSLAVMQMTAGGVAPGPGVITSGTSQIDGTPTMPGSYPVTITVADQSGLIDSATQIIVIAPEPPVIPPPPSIVTFDLPPGTVGVPYTAGLAVAGGVPPWTWGAIGLPAGLSLDPATGIITGTPATAGTFPVTITVADANGAAAVASFEVDISPAPAPPPGP